MLIIVPIVILVILFAFKTPVSFSMLIATFVYYIMNSENMPMEIVAQRLVASMESFSYLAIPFFTMAGVVFNYSGITRRIMNLADLMVGHRIGGLGHVNILVSTLMGGLSGSANADAAMDSKMLVPEMEKRGFSKSYSCAVTAASSCITPIIPPGIILILYASASNVSIARMFYSGYVPGLIMAVSLFIVNHLVSKKRKYAPSRQKRGTAKEIFVALIDAIWALFVPFGILLGLRLGWFTPTEAGAICIVYSIIIGKFVYKELKVEHLPDILKESVLGTAGVMFIIACANAFGSFLTWERLPMMLSDALLRHINSPLMFLFMVNITLLILGMFFDGGAAMVLLAPLLVPAAQSLNINLVHFGLVLCVNLTIAGMSPPFGNMMFVTTSIVGVRIEDYSRDALPFIVALVICLMLFTYIPQISLLLPNLLS